MCYLIQSKQSENKFANADHLFVTLPKLMPNNWIANRLLERVGQHQHQTRRHHSFNVPYLQRFHYLFMIQQQKLFSIFFLMAHILTAESGQNKSNPVNTFLFLFSVFAIANKAKFNHFLILWKQGNLIPNFVLAFENYFIFLNI